MVWQIMVRVTRGKSVQVLGRCAGYVSVLLLSLFGALYAKYPLHRFRLYLSVQLKGSLA